jgi:hypothetical protein
MIAGFNLPLDEMAEVSKTSATMASRDPPTVGYPLGRTTDIRWPRREQKIEIILSHGNHSLRNAVIGSTADARLAGTRHARAATPSSKREAANRMRGFVEAFSTH